MEDVILKLVDITKIYPNGTVANKGINIELKKGEIHSIVGENGAGKSTLMKIIFGIEKQTSGKIFYKGEEANFKNSMDAIDNGIGMVHQHFMLIPSFTVAENIVLGAEPKKGVFVNRKEALEKTKLEVHLSTQSSTLNIEAAKFWKKQGISRIVLGRECTREEIKDIIDNVDIEIETFIHGAMCAGYSGRCVMSNFLTNRDANRGGCSQICRWDFDLLNESKEKRRQPCGSVTMISKRCTRPWRNGGMPKPMLCWTD